MSEVPSSSNPFLVGGSLIIGRGLRRSIKPGAGENLTVLAPFLASLPGMGFRRIMLLDSPKNPVEEAWLMQTLMHKLFPGGGFWVVRGDGSAIMKKIEEKDIVMGAKPWEVPSEENKN